MMTKEDIKARCIAIAKEKVRLTNHRKAREKEVSDYAEQRAKIATGIKSSQKDIQKTINLLCKLDGEQAGLLAHLSEEEKEEVVKELIPYSIPRR